MRSNVSRLFAITGKCSFASFDISKGWLYRTYVTLENRTFSTCKKTLVEINVFCFVTTSFDIKSKTYFKQREKKQRVEKFPIQTRHSALVTGRVFMRLLLYVLYGRL